MKNLQVLHIYENPITQIPTECKVHTLVELNLGGCPLKEWSNVMKLSKLPKLQKLVGKKIKPMRVDQIIVRPGLARGGSYTDSCVLTIFSELELRLLT